MFCCAMSTLVSSAETAHRAVLGDLLRAFPPALVLGVLVGRALERGASVPLWVLAVYLGVAVTILLARPARLPGRGLGAANRVTLARVVLSLPLAALLLDPAGFGTGARWWVVGLGTVALALDGVDGWVARRTGTGTAFGARFDMETDALLLLVLSGLAWRSGQVGAWVFGIGALRYLFVAAGAVLPALRGQLAPSMRRKVICVVQGVALLVAVGPVVPGPLATGVVASALALLIWSFAIDTRALLRAPVDQAAASSPSDPSSASMAA